MSKNLTRAELEEKIIKYASQLRINSETGCFDEDALRQYGESWHELAQYYESEDHVDTVISVDVVREYLDSLNLFFGTWQHPSSDTTCQEQAVEALQELEAQMRYIIAAVERQLYPDGR